MSYKKLISRISLTALLLVKTLAVDEVDSTCKSIEESLHIDVHLGWPFALSCAGLKRGIPYETLVKWSTGNTTAECIIRDVISGMELWDHSFLVDTSNFNYNMEKIKYSIPEMMEDTPSTYLILFRALDHCIFEIVHLNKSRISETQCNALPADYIQDFNVPLGGTYFLPCARKSGPRLYFGDEHRPYINYTWYYNCSEIKDVQIGERGELVIYNARFENAGRYLCVLSYKGQERHMIQHNLCLKYKTSVDHQFSVKCTESNYAPIGGNATVTCVVDLGVGKSNTFYQKVVWEKVDEVENHVTTICDNPTEGKVVEFKNETIGLDAQCLLKSKTLEICYLYEPTHSAPPHDEAVATLTIKNVKPDDLGQYRMTFFYLGRSAVANFTFYSEEDDLLKSKISVISACTAFFLLIVVLAIVALCRKHDVMWYWKKHFGPYEKEIFTYTAYLAYYYDTQSQTISKKSLKLTENLVVALSEWMEKFGGTTYDDQKEISPNQYDTETILHVQSECHRIIIVLTPEYITDQWSLHTTYMALTSVVTSKNKVIFITTPGIEAALDKLEDKPRKTLRYAMKRNITITWTGKTPFNGKFRRRLEYALPKLPPPGYNRYLSTSSHAHLTRHGKQDLPGSPTSTETFMNGFNSMVV